MTNLRRIAFGAAIVLPLAFAGGHAFAFSYTDGPPGYDDGNSFADPDAQFDVTSDHMSQMYDTDTADYSDALTGNSSTGDAAPSRASPGIATPLRLPTNIGGNR